MSNNEPYLIYNSPLSEPLYLKKEIGLFIKNPLLPYLQVLNTKKRQKCGIDKYLVGELDRYTLAFHFYHQSLERFFRCLYYEIKWENDLKLIRGKGKKYTPYQQRVAKEYHAIKGFTLLDFINCLLHARILCDRVVTLSRYFLDGPKLPSFTSFHNHKDFFEKETNSILGNEKYAAYFRQNTDWFNLLKPIRDKFFVHQGPKHMMSLGWNSNYDLTLTLVVPIGDNSDKPLEGLRTYSISMRRLAREINDFLIWFSNYGLEKLT